jgi:toxin HigB-1
VARILYTDSYIRRARKFVKRHPEMVGQYQKTLRLLEENPAHPSLHLHALSGKLSGLYAVSINVSYRISLEILIRDDTIIPVSVGSHDEVYRS